MSAGDKGHKSERNFTKNLGQDVFVAAKELKMLALTDEISKRKKLNLSENCKR